jgi:hypothetical protein
MCCAAFSQDPQQSQSQSGSGATPQQNPPADQSQQQQQPADQPKKHGFGDILSGKKPVSASNSAQSKDSASLGTNGLGADGMPTPAQMNESASAADEAKAQKLSTQVTNKDEVDKFIQQGNLKNGKS